MSEREVEIDKEEGRQDAGGTGGTEEKVVPVVEAMRYRKRAQAAEKELAELKEVQGRQAEELSRLKEEAANAEEGKNNTPSPLRGTPPSQGESLKVHTGNIGNRIC